MDKLSRYRSIIHHLLEEYRAWYEATPEPGVETAVICDDVHGEYLLMRVGWRGETRVRRSAFYLRLKDGQIRVEEDWTQEGIASELAAAGVPQQDVVLAFNPPELRRRAA